MPTLYNGKKLIPVPTASIRVNQIKTGDKENLNYIHSIAINGVILPFKGSPNSSGQFWDQSGYPPDETLTIDKELRNIEAKQTAIRDLFAIEGKTLEFQPWDGGPEIKCNPRIIDIDFPTGQWVSECPYTITFEAPLIQYEGSFGSGYLGVPLIASYNVDNVNDNWTINQNEEENFWTISRDINAKGDRVYDENGNLIKLPWEWARDFVLDQCSNGTLPSFIKFADPLISGISNNFNGYNYSRNSNPNKRDGIFSVTEIWVATSGNTPFIESYEISRESHEDSSLTSVSINGEIRGLSSLTITNQSNVTIPTSGRKLDGANLGFSGVWSYGGVSDKTYLRAKALSEVFDLNPVPLVETVAKRDKMGIINYRRDYDNRPINLVSGTIIERVSVQDQFPENIYPVITVPGRPAPIIQNINANTMGKRNLSITVVMDRNKEPYKTLFSNFSNYASIPRPNVSGIINSFKPNGILGYHWFESQNGTSWLPDKLRLEQNVSWETSVL